MNSTHCFEHALLGDTWVDNVRIGVSSLGAIDSIEAGVSPEAGESVIQGYALPGIPNVHSHAFQRAMRGLAEYSTSPSDSFWTWRDVMYHFAQILTPQDLETIASQLYLEMIKSGYTSVAEFHYLHHQPDGQVHADRAEMSLAILEAAKNTGIGLTHLPVLYMTPDFSGGPLSRQQARFGNDVESFQLLLEGLKPALSGSPQTRLGCAMHSLRAVPGDAQHELLSFLEEINPEGVIHIHIAEQMKEVRDCEVAYGQRPVEWLLNQHDVNGKWCLVHATHLTAEETRALARSGAVAGLCPTTEANLGDGFFPLKSFLDQGGKIALGSDSHISVCPIEEMRWLEYGQRLLTQTRNVVTTRASPHTGDKLIREILDGGRCAMGVDVGAIAVGFRADIAVLDSRSPDIAHKPKENILDSAIFSGNGNNFRAVMAGGNWVVNDYVHSKEERITERYLALLERITCEPLMSDILTPGAQP